LPEFVDSLPEDDTLIDSLPPDETVVDGTLPDETAVDATPLDDTALDRGAQIGSAPTIDGSSASDTIHDTRAPHTAGTTTITGNTILPRIERATGTTPKIVSDAKQRFEINKRLGEGAAGAVDLALDNDIQRQVAVKWLKASPDDAEMVLRFADEVRMVGHLEHPNIVPIHDVGRTDDGRYYFVMKHVQGETLESVIHKLAEGNSEYHRKYSFEYRTEIFSELLKAVEFAHHYGIIHRDLKPANIMIGSYGEVMVMDWGIAKHIRTGRDDALRSSPPASPILDEADEAEPRESQLERMYTTGHGSVIGTPLYMSPEQVRGNSESLDERSDIYGLCAVFYELITLQPYLPPKGTVEEVLKDVLTHKPRHPMRVSSKVQTTVPVHLGHYIMKGLAKDPGERYQTIGEMRERLQRIDEGYIPVQCPFSFTKRAIFAGNHILDRHPILTVGTLVVALVLVACGGFLLSQSLMQ